MNFAVVGLGTIGIMHAAMLRQIPGAKLAALVDNVPKIGKHVQSMMSEPPPVFGSVKEALQHVELKGVFVCTPPFTHRAIAEECLESKLDVFVEKPLAQSLKDAEAMFAARRKHAHAVVAVGYMKAHEGLYKEVERLLKNNALGTLRGFEASCYLSQVLAPKSGGWIYDKERSGGGMVINSTCHLLHALFRWFGEAQAVTANCKSIHSGQVEDEATAEIEYAQVRGRITSSWSVPGYDVETSAIRVEGDAGRLEVIDDRTLRLDLNAANGGYQPGEQVRPRSAFDRSRFNLSPAYGGEGYYQEDADFVVACVERRSARVGWDQGLAVQHVIDAIYRSNGQRVVLKPERAA